MIALAPAQYDGTLSELVSSHLTKVMPTVAAVERVHAHLLAYCARSDSVFLLRCKTSDDRRRFAIVSPDTTVRWTDNAPAWAMHQALIANTDWSAEAFAAFMRDLPTHMFDIRGETVNSANYYVAHVFPVGRGVQTGLTWSREQVVARFIRNVHPANHFYFPNPTKGVGRRYGEDRRVIAALAEFNAGRYSAIWDEFLDLSMAKEELPVAPVQWGMKVRFGPADKCGAVSQFTDLNRGDMTNRLRSSRGPRMRKHPADEVNRAGSSSETSDRNMPAPIASGELLVARIPLGSSVARRWTGNDTTNRHACHHHVVVPRKETPMLLDLYWRNSSDAPPWHVGSFRLDLVGLLAYGYIREEGTSDSVRVRIHRDGDIYYVGLGKGRASLKLPVE